MDENPPFWVQSDNWRKNDEVLITKHEMKFSDAESIVNSAPIVFILGRDPYDNSWIGETCSSHDHG